MFNSISRDKSTTDVNQYLNNNGNKIDYETQHIDEKLNNFLNPELSGFNAFIDGATLLHGSSTDETQLQHSHQDLVEQLHTYLLNEGCSSST